MLVVYPFCEKDWLQTVKNIEWAKELDGHLPFTAILSHDDETSPAHVGEAKKAAEAVFSKVEVFWYPAPVKKSWPAAPNWAWQNVARYIAAIHKEPWLFLEADAIPIRKGWLADIAAEHARAGQPFSGHVVDGMGHLTGVAVYPPMVAEYSYNAMMCEEMAWDVVLGKDIQGKIHAAHTLFQHSWCINPATGKAWNGNGEIPTFKDTHDLVRLVDLSMALFHRNKDGTLIEQLRRFYAHPEEAMVPRHTKTEAVRVESLHDSKGSHHTNAGGCDTLRESTDGSTGILQTNAGGNTADGPKSRTAQPFTGKCEILIVTYHKDSPWLQYALATMRRHARGFNGVTIAIPKRDRNAFAWLSSIDLGMPIRVQLYDEAPGKGMIHHMAMMASADRLVPEDVTHILHFDADCMVKTAITPDSYFNGTKPIYVIRSYTGLTDPKSKVVSDCIQWQVPTQAQLGFDTDIYTMCRHPTGFPKEFYPVYRAHIERVQGREFFAYMLSGKNSHPANRMDFTAMGAFAYRYLHEKFDWWNVDNEPAPVDLVKPYWSHGGITDGVKAEVEGFLK